MDIYFSNSGIYFSKAFQIPWNFGNSSGIFPQVSQQIYQTLVYKFPQELLPFFQIFIEIPLGIPPGISLVIIPEICQ